MKAKKMAMVMAAIALVGAVGIGSTLAYLTDSTDTVTNTFTVGNIGIDLTESLVKYSDGVGYVDDDGVDRTLPNTNKTGNAYENLVPGDSIYKDPTVTVAANSADCYVFVEVTGVDKNGIVPFEMNAAWKKLTDGVYYQVVDKSANVVELSVFKNTTVTMNANLVATDLENEINDITVKAYAIQKDHIEAAEGMTAQQVAYDTVKAAYTSANN